VAASYWALRFLPERARLAAEGLTQRRVDGRAGLDAAMTNLPDLISSIGAIVALAVSLFLLRQGQVAGPAGAIGARRHQAWTPTARMCRPSPCEARQTKRCIGHSSTTFTRSVALSASTSESIGPGHSDGAVQSLAHRGAMVNRLGMISAH
jgi:hypothetical protein